MSDDKQPNHAYPPEAGRAAFPGAARAEQYVESPEQTITGEELAAAQERLAAAPVTDEEPAPSLPEVPYVPPVPQAAPPAAAQLPPAPSTPAGATDLLAEPLPLHDLGLLAKAQKPVTATKGMRGAFSRMGIRMAPGAAEQQELAAAEQLRQAEEIVRQATWTRAVSVLVANPKGGVGKTPVSLGIGGVLAAVRGGSVAILEVSDDPGALTFRAEGSPALGLGELMRDVEKIGSAGQLAGYTAPQTSFASVIGTVGRRPRLNAPDVEAIAHLVDEYYGIRVMDSGNQPSSSAFQGAIGTADVLVIPTFNAGDSILEAIGLLDGLRAAGGHAEKLANTAVLLRLTDGRPENHQVVERVDRIIQGAGLAQVHTIPYDAHIAERGPITLGNLNPQTYSAFAAAAAGVIRALQSNVR